MFLGNANQEAELRAAPFKGLLRYWWRVAEGSEGYKHETHEALLKAENAIFGSADEDTGGKSQVKIGVKCTTPLQPKKDQFKNSGNIDHPECEKSQCKINPLNYLAGIGLINYKRSYFPAGEKFTLQLEAPEQILQQLESTLAIVNKFGAIGSRSRNGWGCFQWPVSQSNVEIYKTFENAFNREYPHCLAKDEKGLLLWKTKKLHKTWEMCMRELAEIYVSVRIKLDVNKGSPPDRHLLGYPVTNHIIQLKHWEKKGRHASALRLIVRKENEQYRGYFLHLPHLFSKQMWPNDKTRQIEIWRNVHKTLGQYCDRANF
jgi:CRISPR-associated protein Cmr1